MNLGKRNLYFSKCN